MLTSFSFLGLGRSQCLNAASPQSDSPASAFFHLSQGSSMSAFIYSANVCCHSLPERDRGRESQNKSNVVSALEGLIYFA